MDIWIFTYYHDPLCCPKKPSLTKAIFWPPSKVCLMNVDYSKSDSNLPCAIAQSYFLVSTKLIG